MKRWGLLGVLIGLIAGVLWLWLGGQAQGIFGTASSSALPVSSSKGIPDSHSSEFKPKPTQRELPKVVDTPGQIALQPYVPPGPISPEERSPMADKLNAAEQPAGEDLKIVYSLFGRYRESFGGFPSGEGNREIVNALSGNNPSRLAILPRDHPAISPAGELLDRWSSPYFFHQISSQYVEIRSAGPDRTMWTEDDQTYKTPGPEPDVRR